MSHVRSKDSEIEKLFRKELWRNGFRYQKNSSKYFGKPDIVLLKYKAVVFVDSCFWHGCKKHCRIPIIHKNYWTKKIVRNAVRDKEVSRHYKNQGWKIFRVWEHSIKQNGSKAIQKIVSVLKNEKIEFAPITPSDARSASREKFIKMEDASLVSG